MNFLEKIRKIKKRKVEKTERVENWQVLPDLTLRVTFIEEPYIKNTKGVKDEKEKSK